MRQFVGFPAQVILSVIGLIALAVVIMTPADDGPRYAGRKIRVEDLVSINFKPKKFNKTWVSGKVQNCNFREDAPNELDTLNFLI